MRKFLLITSYFPPLGGPGVQRQLSYVRLARKWGWEPVVLTVSDVIYHYYDESLLQKIPEGVYIERTESLEFGRLFWHLLKIKNQLLKNHKNSLNSTNFNENKISRFRSIREWLTIVDDRILWIPFAIPKALKLLKINDIDVIVSRGGPHSNTILGYLISKLTKTPHVLDLADPWVEYPYFQMPTFIHYWINTNLEKKVFNSASKIIVSAPIMKEIIHRKYKGIKDKDVIVITNGFEKSEMTEASLIDDYSIFTGGKKFTITHVGNINWIRHQSFVSLCQSLSDLIKEMPELKLKIKICIVGLCDFETKAKIRDYSLEEITKYYGYLPHEEVLSHLKSADLLFLPISEEVTNKFGVYVIPGKLYEYIGSGTKILMIGPSDCDAAKIILAGNFGFVFNINEISNVKSLLSNLILLTKPSNLTRNHSKKIDNKRTLQFDREFLVKRFINTLVSASNNTIDN